MLKKHVSSPASKSVANNDAPAPPMLSGIAPAGNGGRLPNLMESHSNAPTPVLQALNVSQGVSQGLLVKKVQPKYPPNALRARIEGSVQLLATISKNGDISTVKILSGDSQLSHAAADAVKQWKYKPYLLNGSPVEIQTQITVNFKVPN
jgi:protein TonB